MATVEDAPVTHVRALWRPEQFTRVANGGFEVNTTGWATTVGINAAIATSITRITTDFRSGVACASVVCTSSTGSGVNFDLGTERFFVEASYGTTYVALVWLKRTSGSRRVQVILGSLGTPADRGTLTIDDLPDVWTPYRVIWMPTANRTDVELAITNGSDLVATAVTFRVDDVTIYQTDAFSQVENSNFAVDATGWVVTAGINGAGTSITQATGDGFTYATTLSYATLVTTATSGSGVNFDMGLRKFTSGRTYRLRVAMKSVSGTTSARIRIGSLGTPADRGDLSMTITASWAWYLVDWTASGDRTDVEVAITNGTAAIMTARIGAVEVYEAIDELNGTGTGVRADVSHMDWTRGISGTGTLNLVLHDPRNVRRYTPWDTSGALYGLLEPGRRVWARAVYANVIYPVAFGTIRRIIPDATTGSCSIMCEDPMYDIAATSYSVGFTATTSYAGARGLMFGASAVALGVDPVAGDRRVNATLAGVESGNFYNGTNGDTNALDYLEQLNEATGTEHFIDPDARSEVLWRYTTDARQDMVSAASSDETIDDDFNALTGTDKTDETLENNQSVTWQAYEALPFWAGYTQPLLVAAYDPVTYPTQAGENGPYLTFVDDQYGADDGTPAPTFEREWQWKRRRRRKGAKKSRVRDYNFRRVYTDAFLPFTLASGETRTWVIDFAIPMSAVYARVGSAYDDVKASPRQVVITGRDAYGTTSYFEVYGTPWLPLDEVTETRVAYDQVLDKGVRYGPSFNTPHIRSQGDAQALGDFRNWRYATSRMRPVLNVQHRFPSLLTRRPTEHLTVNAALFSLAGAVFVINSLSGSVDQGGLAWNMDWAMEELPPSIGTPVTLGTSVLGGTNVLSY